MVRLQSIATSFVLLFWFSTSLQPVLLEAQNNPFLFFSWKKINSRGPNESYQVELNEKGTGQIQIKMREGDPVNLDVVLKLSAIDHLLSLFVQADFFNESKNFVSPRKVADMGMKTVRFESGSRNREVVYNYTEDKALQEISNFFENLCSQERTLFELDLALKYDRLGIPKKLDELELSFSAKRIVAPERFAPILEKIYQDTTLINLARKEAKKLLSRIRKMQAYPN